MAKAKPIWKLELGDSAPEFRLRATGDSAGKGGPQKEIALGTAYAVWTGIGAAGTFMVGVWLFGDPGSLGRYLGAVLIIAGVATLKLAH